jgi:glycosyltransferase involved in cell wall biosynthesis
MRRQSIVSNVADDADTFASVVVPTRRRPDGLRRTIESVRSQDLAEWEVIVVDDGAGEGIEAAEAFGDPRVRALRNAGTGQADARNTGISHARGEIVCWLDDDDWWCDPAHLSLLGRWARASGGRGFAYRSGWIVFEDEHLTEVSRELFDHEATADSLRVNNTILSGSLAYPREVHRELGLLDREVGGYGDWDLMLRMCDAGLVPERLEGIGVCYSIHGSNVSGVFDAPERRLFFERFAAKHGLDIQLANHLRIHRLLTDAAAG